MDMKTRTENEALKKDLITQIDNVLDLEDEGAIDYQLRYKYGKKAGFRWVICIEKLLFGDDRYFWKIIDEKIEELQTHFKDTGVHLNVYTEKRKQDGSYYITMKKYIM